jgi:hypothetical protein
MTSEINKDEAQDKILWEIARKRASFKSHLITYLVINAFLWIIWAFIAGGEKYGYPWPLFAMFGWGIGLVFHYLDAYVFRTSDPVEREYQKLKEKQKSN